MGKQAKATFQVSYTRDGVDYKRSFTTSSLRGPKIFQDMELKLKIKASEVENLNVSRIS